jgi:hypothetical protein
MKDYYSDNHAMWRANFMNNFSCNGKKRIKDCEKKNMVWLLAFKARTRFTKPLDGLTF